MKILVINGSPKGEKSNTYQLTTAFLDGLRSAVGEEVMTEVLSLKQLQVKPCLGCFSCWNKTPGQCCIRDDMQTVLEKQLWADLILWSFPLYYFSVPGSLKTLIDRQLPMVLPFMNDAESGGHPSRYDMSGKRHVVISTCGFHTAKGNYDGVTAMFDHMLGKGQYTTIFCGQGELFRVPELRQRTAEYLDAVKRAGEEFAHNGITAQTRSLLEQPLYPREVFERMADASWGIDSDSGEKPDETYIFTKQMAALYRKESFSGKEIVLEMFYTDADKRYQIILQQQGCQILTDHFRPFTTRIETPYTVWKAIASGEISGQDALAQQKYRVQGDFNLMIHWDDYFGADGVDETKVPDNAGKTNMNILLLPWIVFWVAAAINPFYGALISILTCVLVPLIYYKNRKTIYDTISGAAVTALSSLILLDINIRFVIPLAYLCFGLMWLISCG